MLHHLKSLLSIAVLVSFTLISRSQTLEWEKSSQWTLYNVQGNKFYKIVLDSLNNYNCRRLNDDSMHAFLSQISILHSENSPIWMGAYVTSCIIDHKKHKIDISSYGGFFFDETDKQYYTVIPEVQKNWLDYLAECTGSIPQKE